jgi:hypothetical protein
VVILAAVASLLGFHTIKALRVDRQARGTEDRWLATRRGM